MIEIILGLILLVLVVGGALAILLGPVSIDSSQDTGHDRT